MSYIGTGINNSATIVAKAADAIPSGAFLAAEMKPDGTIKVASAGAAAIGLFIPETNSIQAGGDVHVQIKDMGRWKTGGAVSAGALLASDASGKAVAASGGAFALAIALEPAADPDQVIKVQVVKAGAVD